MNSEVSDCQESPQSTRRPLPAIPTATGIHDHQAADGLAHWQSLAEIEDKDETG